MDSLIIGGETIHSCLIVDTGKYKDGEHTRQTIVVELGFDAVASFPIEGVSR